MFLVTPLDVLSLRHGRSLREDKILYAFRPLWNTIVVRIAFSHVEEVHVGPVEQALCRSSYPCAYLQSTLGGISQHTRALDERTPRSAAVIDKFVFISISYRT